MSAPGEVPNGWLTVMSNLEDVAITKILNACYAPPTKAKPAPAVPWFMHLSPWNDAETLVSVVAQTVISPLNGGRVSQLDIVGHALLDKDFNAEGFVMGKPKQVGLGVIHDQLVGAQCLSFLAQEACTPDVTVRLILCSGETLSAEFLARVYDTIRCNCPEATLLHTKDSVQPPQFGPGGFNDPQALTQYP